MDKSTLKVMTYNIQSGRSGEDISTRSFDRTADTIKAQDADIVGLQEVGKHPTAGFPEYPMEGEPTEYLANQMGYNGYFACASVFRGKYRYGNAILTKHKIKSAKTFLIPDPDDRTPDNDYFETRSILVAEIDALGGLTVLVTHFGLMPSEKKNAVDTVISLIKDIKTPIILMGDLNMTPEDEMLDPIFKALNDINGRRSTPITWPSNLNYVGAYESKIKGINEKKKAARKIDYIFISNDLESEDSQVVSTMTSDHMPYITYIRRNNRYEH